MGYDLHITRAKRWPDSKRRPIAAEEWLRVVAQDPDLRLAGINGPYFSFWNVAQGNDWGAWLDWRDGEIHTKNPDEALIEKMVELANKLGATVQGDDLEVYPGGQQPPFQVPQSTPERVRAELDDWSLRLRYWLAHWQRKRKMAALTESFQPGQQVKDVYGRVAVVIAVDARRPPGLGKISIRYEDGRELQFALVACGLTPVASEETSRPSVSPKHRKR